MSSFTQSVRALTRSPGFALAGVATLALGIGGGTAMFGLIHAALLRPLPYEAPDRLVKFRDLYLPTGGSGGVSTPNFLDLQERTRAFSELAVYASTSFNVAGGDRPERASGLAVSHNFLSTLGMSPALGRSFAEGEDRAGREDVVVITHAVWQDRFEGSPDVLGRTLLLDARPHTVVGVLPEEFWFPGVPQVVVPFAWNDAQLSSRGNRWLEGIGRLSPGVSPQAGETELREIFAQIAVEQPAGNENWSVQAWPFAEWALGANRTSLYLLAGAVLLVLLIGSVNVANLMLVRAERRASDLAVRIALGAGKARIARQHVAEGVILALAGALAGLALAAGGTRLVLGLYGNALPRAEDVALSLPVLGFALALALLVGALIGLVPVLRLNDGRIYEVLRSGGRGATAHGNRLQKGLVVLEVAVAVVLVTGAALLIHSFWRVNAIETGLELDHALVFSVQLPFVEYDSPERSAAFFDEALSGIVRLPGVRAAGITERTPLQGGYNITTLTSPSDPEISSSFVELRTITPGFFEAAGIPLLDGRLITPDDVRQQRAVVVISDALARDIFPAGDAIGRHILADWQEGGFEVVGIAGSVRDFGVLGDRRPAVYWPFQVLGQRNNMTFVVRTQRDPIAAVPAIRQTLAGIDPALPIYEVRTLRDVMIATTGARWLATNLFAAFGTLALLLAALGIFAVLAFVVEQRTREIGIRVALGATAGHVRWMVVMQALRLVGAGLAIGLGAAIVLSRLLADLLHEIRPTDLATFVTVAGVALLTAGAAAYLPAHRATRSDPMAALREQ